MRPRSRFPYLVIAAIAGIASPVSCAFGLIQPVDLAIGGGGNGHVDPPHDPEPYIYVAVALAVICVASLLLRARRLRRLERDR